MGETAADTREVVNVGVQAVWSEACRVAAMVPNVRKKVTVEAMAS